MSQVKAIVGHVMVETAKRKRTCWRHRTGRAAHPILKDETCLVVKDPDGSKANYCLDAARDILQRAEGDLADLRSALGI